MKLSRVNLSEKIITIFVSVLVLCSCAPRVRHFAQYNNLLLANNYSEGAELIKSNEKEYGSKSKLLYMLDMGLALHYAGQFEESIKELRAAELLIDELYTRSLTNEAASYLVNDNVLKYTGEDFEQVLVNVFLALNYTMLGKQEDALIEARKVGHKLAVMNDRYETKNIYKDDAFARYLSGMLYEREHNLNDALISYRHAYKTYVDNRRDYKTGMPVTVKTDLLRAADGLHFNDEVKKYKDKFKLSSWDSYKTRKSLSEIVIFSYTGISPVKMDEFIDAQVPDGQGSTYLLRIAFPKYHKQPSEVTGCTVTLDDTVFNCELMEDIESIALKNLDDRIARISAKAIARAGVKYLAARALRNKADNTNQLIGLMTKVATDAYSVASEVADKRSWRTLPSKIYMARVPVPDGSHTAVVNYTGANGQLIASKTYTVKVKPKETIFLSNRLIR